MEGNLVLDQKRAAENVKHERFCTIFSKNVMCSYLG